MRTFTPSTPCMSWVHLAQRLSVRGEGKGPRTRGSAGNHSEKWSEGMQAPQGREGSQHRQNE